MKLINNIKYKIKSKKENSDFNNFLNKKVIFSILFIILLIIGLSFTAYSLFFRVNETLPETVNVGDLEITYSTIDGMITRTDQDPHTDAQGNATDPYIVTITNTGDLVVTCTLLMTTDNDYLTTNNLTAVADNEMKYSINATKNELVSSLNGVLTKKQLLPGESVTYNVRFWLKSDASNDAIGKAFVKRLQAKAEYKPIINPYTSGTFANTLIENTPPTEYITTPGQEQAILDEGLIEGPNDDYGDTTYYYRGAVTNNYVSFAGLTWKIIRINGDGTVRMILDDYTDATGAMWNANYSSTDYATAMSYISYENSAVKTHVETWYNTNIGNNTTYSSKVATTKFCNDKSGITEYTGYHQYFTLYNRLFLLENPSPMMTCPNASDIYNLNVGIMTADEVIYAGNKQAYNNPSSYLYNSDLVEAYMTSWWIMAPYMWSSSGYIVGFYVRQGGVALMGGEEMNAERLVRPVISLKDDVTVTTTSGTNPGTSSNPYIVQ